MKKLKKGDILLMSEIAIMIMLVAAMFVANRRPDKHNAYNCAERGGNYNFELFGDAICEADDAGKKERLESDLLRARGGSDRFIPYYVTNLDVVKRTKNPDGNYTMEVVGKYGCSGCKGMQYRGIFRNVVSSGQEKQR